MKYYLFTTCIVFALIVVAHILRLFAEGTRLLREPDFIISTAIAIMLFGWAMFLIMKFPKPN
jgi:hypothetical protein